MVADPISNTAPRLALRIELPNGARLGPGKIALLESLRRHRSIAAAAREHGMSYRRAWLLVDNLNRAFSEPVVATFPGRSQGAGASLTAFGERLVSLYRSAEQQALQAAAEPLGELTAASDARYRWEVSPAPRRKTGARGA
jgi:molybdate transport system regulatory protein